LLFVVALKTETKHQSLFPSSGVWEPWVR